MGAKTRLLALALALALVGGCQARPETAQRTLLAMDTVMTLTLQQEEGPEEVLDRLARQVDDLEAQLSPTQGDSEISALNEGAGEWVALSSSTLELLARAKELGELTGGTLDITAHSALLAWGFTTGDYRVPGEEELEALADNIDYTKVELDPQRGAARLPAGMSLDLGAVAKGYAADLLCSGLEEGTHALLDLGQSTIAAVGTKADGSPWRIGVQDPLEEGGMLGVLELEDVFLGTSGGYQRYFEEDGQRYWHILDPDTAAPARSGLASVVVVGPSGLLCDGLSTALFVMGREGAVDFWRSHPELDLQLLLVEEDGTVLLTPGLEDKFTLEPGYQGREVEVLHE